LPIRMPVSWARKAILTIATILKSALIPICKSSLATPESQCQR
jgi:hypothetical protein